VQEWAVVVEVVPSLDLLEAQEEPDHSQVAAAVVAVVVLVRKLLRVPEEKAEME
jgi:hypothetical protein